MTGFNAETYLKKILEHAKDGQQGSHRYSLDRLVQIERLTKLGLKRLKAERSAA